MARVRRAARRRRYQLSLELATELAIGPSYLDEAALRAAYFALRDELIGRGQFGAAFWRYEPGIPDDLRADVEAPDPRQPGWELAAIAYDAHEHRRQAYLRAHYTAEATHAD